MTIGAAAPKTVIGRDPLFRLSAFFMGAFLHVLFAFLIWLTGREGLRPQIAYVQSNTRVRK